MLFFIDDSYYGRITKYREGYDNQILRKCSYCGLNNHTRDTVGRYPKFYFSSIPITSSTQIDNSMAHLSTSSTPKSWVIDS